LIAYCSRADCPTFEEVARLPWVNTGTCLDLQYVVDPEGVIGNFSTSALFFNASGTLTAVQVTADDGSLCGGTSSIKSYGPVPSCDADECGRFWCSEGH
jgi:hypothetical protein